MAAAAEEIEKQVREEIAKTVGCAGKSSIDEIVNRVLAAMQARGDATYNLTIDSPLISLAELEGRLTGIRQLVVPARAVITPAARDLLRQKRIDVSYAAATKTVGKTRMRLVMGSAETNYDPAALLHAAARGGVEIERLARTGLVQVVREIAEETTKGGKLGLLLTGETAAALCLANRCAGVRAVAATNVEALAKSARSVGANVLVIDPAGRGTFEMHRLISQFVAGAPYACPAAYAKQLA